MGASPDSLNEFRMVSKKGTKSVRRLLGNDRCKLETSNRHHWRITSFCEWVKFVYVARRQFLRNEIDLTASSRSGSAAEPKLTRLARDHRLLIQSLRLERHG